MGKERIDKLLVDLGLAESREKAQALIMAGKVFVNQSRVRKAATAVEPTATIQVRGGLPYVSRGGIKLEGALRSFAVDVAGKVCLDLGASTGGFTDCLLQFGARKVYAVDVGRGLLDWRLRNDPRVVGIEGINARYLTADLIPEEVDLVTIDLSFISLKKILPPLRSFLDVRARGAVDIIALIKPQFEVGKGEVGRGGIVKDPEKHMRVVSEIKLAAKALGFSVEGVSESAVLGSEGNKEFFIHLRFAKGR